MKRLRDQLVRADSAVKSAEEHAARVGCAGALLELRKAREALDVALAEVAALTVYVPEGDVALDPYRMVRRGSASWRQELVKGKKKRKAT